MTEHHDINHPAFDQAINLILESGLDGFPDAMKILLDQAMVIQRAHHLGAAAHQRSPERDGHANGFKPKTIRTRFGEVVVQVPQVRDSSTPFYPSAFERGQRSEVALKTAIAEMYLQGVSTRKVTEVMEKLCGFEVTSMEVSRANEQLDEMLEKWRTRPIDEEIAFLVLDATYAKVRTDQQVRSCPPWSLWAYQPRPVAASCLGVPSRSPRPRSTGASSSPRCASAVSIIRV